MAIEQIGLGFAVGAGVAALGVALSINSITVKVMDLAAKFFSDSRKPLMQDIVLKSAGITIVAGLTFLGYNKISPHYKMGFLTGSMAVLAVDVGLFLAAHFLRLR